MKCAVGNRGHFPKSRQVFDQGALAGPDRLPGKIFVAVANCEMGIVARRSIVFGSSAKVRTSSVPRRLFFLSSQMCKF